MPDAIRYSHALSYVTGQDWAIQPEKMTAILDFIHAKAAGETIDPALVAEYQAAAQSRPKQQRAGGVAVLPVFGTISHRMNMMSAMSGGTSVETLTAQFRSLVNDPDIAAIVLDVDSPGGTVNGLDELATEIYKARGKKPITAVANTIMASGAYWLAASADEIVVTSSALVGSIGVIAAHEDRSKLMDKMGINVSLVTAGKYKAENNPYEPMTDEGREAIQKRVDEHYGMFTKAVARGRGVPIETVRGGFGEGRVVGAREAVSLGMADRIGTIDEVVATIGRVQDVGQQSMGATLHGMPYIVDTSMPDGVIEARHSDGRVQRFFLPPQTFENEADAALTAVRSVQARVEALTALRDGRNTPVSQARVPLLMEHRDAYRAVAEAYDALVAACRTDTADLATRRMARASLHDLNMWLAEVG